MTATGQKPDREDCRRLAPTKAAKTSHHELCSHASATLMIIKEPANANIILSMFIVNLHFLSCDTLWRFDANLMPNAFH